MSDDDKRINDESSGSDSSDDDDVRAVDTTNVDAGLFSSDEDEDGSDAGVQQENVKYVDEHVVIPFADRPERSSVDPSKFEMLVAHLPATIDVIPEPFAKDQYDKDAEEKLLAERNKSFAAYSLIRHRIDDRTGRVQSNTRLVEYSDGSRVLFVGKEAFHAPVGASTKNSFVALNRRASRGDGSTYVLQADTVGTVALAAWETQLPNFEYCWCCGVGCAGHLLSSSRASCSISSSLRV